jgi:hypothetical protein
MHVHMSSYLLMLSYVVYGAVTDAILCPFLILFCAAFMKHACQNPSHVHVCTLNDCGAVSCSLCTVVFWHI